MWERGSPQLSNPPHDCVERAVRSHASDALAHMPHQHMEVIKAPWCHTLLRPITRVIAQRRGDHTTPTTAAPLMHATVSCRTSPLSPCIPYLQGPTHFACDVVPLVFTVSKRSP